MNENLASLKIFSSRITYAVLAIFFLAGAGTVGFVVIEDYSWLDGFFMTIITMSTVGYEEVKPLSDQGKIFTSILIICSFSTFAYAISVITTYFVSGQFKNSIIQRRMIKKLENLENHTIICGYGRVGRKSAQKLKGYGKEFVVLELDQDRSEHITRKDDFLCVFSDATKEKNLIESGLEKASALITTLPKDADNLYVVLTARQLNPDIRIISRASEPESVKKLKMAGANNVIMPDGVGGAHMASLVVNPDIMEFMDHVSIQGANEVNLEEIILSDISSFKENISIRKIKDLNRKVNIIGCKRGEGEFLINPSNDLELTKEDKLFVLSLPQDLAEFTVH